jgi:tripartite ATP-independent transporter DctM subunit
LDAGIAVIFAFVVFGILLLLSVEIAVALALSGVVGCFLYRGDAGLTAIVPFAALNSFILTAIPLFIFMGEILGRCGASDTVYSSASKWLAWAPGGLLHSNIGACAMFAAISGSSPATAATIGTVAIPRLKERGYDPKLLLGSLAAGGTLGILIPPSINMIVYASLTWTSVAALFAGGVVPGIMLSIMFMIYIAIRVIKNPTLAPRDEKVASLKQLLLSLIGMWPFLIMAVVVLGGIFGGLMTPTEAAAVGSVTAIIIGLILRRLNWRVFRECATGATSTTAMVLFIVMGSFIFSSFLAITGVPLVVSAYVGSLGWSEVPVLLAICVLYIFLGCFISPLAIIVITLPTLLPILAIFGTNLVWFGVIAVVLSEIGMITPPMGMNLFIIQGISGERLEKVILGSIPFFLIMMLAIAVMIAFPSIVMWFPSLLGF